MFRKSYKLNLIRLGKVIQMCAPVSVTLSGGASLSAILPQIFAIIAMTVGAVWCFATRRKTAEV